MAPPRRPDRPAPRAHPAARAGAPGEEARPPAPPGTFAQPDASTQPGTAAPPAPPATPDPPAAPATPDPPATPAPPAAPATRARGLDGWRPPPGAIVVHATTVAHAGRALLIRGASGAGKSALAMEMIGLGARLVADDRTVLHAAALAPQAAPPPAIAGLIEVRGLGLLRLPHVADVPLGAVLDLDHGAPDRLPPDRLPPNRTTRLCGHDVPLYSRVAGAHFAAALMQCLAGARVDP